VDRRADRRADAEAGIDILRARGGLRPFRWTDPVLRPGVTPVKLAHLLELRLALAVAVLGCGTAERLSAELSAPARRGRRTGLARDRALPRPSCYRANVVASASSLRKTRDGGRRS